MAYPFKNKESMMYLPVLPHWVAAQVAAALLEDVGTGDLSAKLIPAHPATAQVISREHCILCGQLWFNASFTQLDPGTHITWHIQEGQWVMPNTVLCTLHGLAPG